MSRASIYQFGHDGKFAGTFAEVHNGMAGAPVIWAAMAHKYGLCDFMESPHSPKVTESVWKTCNAGKMSRGDTICVRFTYDTVWVKRDNCNALADALMEFHRAHVDGTGIEQTIRGLASGLRSAACDVNWRGYAFQMTSVVENQWCAYDPVTDEEIPYDLNTGTKHFELFAEALPPESR